MMPRVSVTMAVRNGARWLREAVDSVLAQTLRDIELIVVDDGSTDETPEILSAATRRDERVRMFRQDRIGVVQARNRGLEAARAPLVAVLDADDIALPERLDRQASYFDAHPEIGMLGSWAQTIDDLGAVHKQLTPETQPEKLVSILQRNNPFVHSSVMFRTDLVRSIGGYRPAFPTVEDYDLWLRITELTNAANLPEVLVQYRRHEAGLTQLQPVKQAFLHRIAQRSAKSRRDTGRDPSESFKDVPDWRSMQVSFFADDAALYQILECADPTIAAQRVATGVYFLPLLDCVGELSHAERALAVKSIIQYAKLGSYSQALQATKLIFGLIRKRPGIILLLISAFRSS